MGARFSITKVAGSGSDPIQQVRTRAPHVTGKVGLLLLRTAMLCLENCSPDFSKDLCPGADQPLDSEVVRRKFKELAETASVQGNLLTPEQAAEGFLSVAVENMANAIKKISVQRGYNVKEYTLCCFGGAGAQHACRVADALGVKSIFIHPYAGVLSAYGMGLADQRLIKEQYIGAELSEGLVKELKSVFTGLEAKGRLSMLKQGVREVCIDVLHRAHVRYAGSDTQLAVDFADSVASLRAGFEEAHKKNVSDLQWKASPLL